MLSILVVDDDRNEREGIRFLLNNLGLQIEISEFPNGEAALNHITCNPADILITDIKMPFMDGLTLGESARGLVPGIKIIIMSAYGDFDYARRAISFDANEYMLKPIDPQEFSKVVLKAARACETEQLRQRENHRIYEQLNRFMNHAKEKLLMDLISGRNINEQITKGIDALNLGLCNPVTRLVLIDAADSFFENNSDFFREGVWRLAGGETHCTMLNESQALLFSGADWSAKRKEAEVQLLSLLQKQNCERYFIIVGREITDYKGFAAAYQELETILEYKFFSDASKLIFADEFTQLAAETQTETLINNVFSQFDSFSLNYAFHQAHALLDLFANNSLHSAIYVKYYVCEIIKKLTLKANAEELHTQYLHRVFYCADMLKLHSILEELEQELQAAPRENAANDDRSVIKAVKELVEKEYMNPLGLTEISERIYLTPSYLSYLFKKETGSSFIQYLTQYRLQKAKELLYNTNIRIVDAGSMVGYTNPSYFSLLFKSYFGVSPAKFREMKGRDGQ